MERPVRNLSSLPSGLDVRRTGCDDFERGQEECRAELEDKEQDEQSR